MTTQSNIQFIPKSASINVTLDGAKITRRYTLYGWATESNASVAFYNWLLSWSTPGTIITSPTGTIARLDTYDLNQVGDDFIYDPDVDDAVAPTSPPNYGATRGSGVYEVTCNWSTQVGKKSDEEEDEDEQRNYSITIDSRTTHRDFSFSTKHRVSAKARAPGTGMDHDGAINVVEGKTGIPEIKGTDVPGPAGMMYTVERTYAHLTITKADLKTVSSYRNTVNNAPFEGFAAGEVVFLGVDLSFNASSGEEKINWSFGINANVDDFRPLGYVPGAEPDPDPPKITKLGWDYFWVHYKHEHEDGAGDVRKKMVMIADAWYLEEVLETRDWHESGKLVDIMNQTPPPPPP